MKESSPTSYGYITLLDHQAVYIAPAVCLLYIFLQSLAYFYFTNTLCQEYVDYNQYTLTVLTSVAACFTVHILYQLAQLLLCAQNSSMTAERKYSHMKGLFCTLSICILSGSSQWLTVSSLHGQIGCVDAFGVYSPFPQWSEWLVTVPFLAYLACAIENKPQLSFTDSIFIACTAGMILFGCLMIMTPFSQVSGVILLAASFCCQLGTMYSYHLSFGQAVLTMEDIKLDYNSSETLNIEQSIRSKQTEAKFQMQKYLLILFPYFLIVYLLGLVKVIDPDSIFCLNAIGSLVGKLLFVSILMDKHCDLHENCYFLMMSEIRANSVKVMAEEYANELRLLISNVAHDLKSPLSGLISGLEIIQLTNSDLKGTMKKLQQTENLDKKNVDSIMEGLKTISSSSKNVQNINSLMLMTINRCLDYAKASKGLKLVPKLDTISLRDALRIPTEVMNDLQQRIQVEVRFPGFSTLGNDSDSNTVHPYIVTDKQWLFENLLCYLSNGVKYTGDDSKVTLDITKITREMVVKLSSSKTSSEVDENETISRTSTVNTNLALPGDLASQFELYDNSLDEEIEKELTASPQPRLVFVSEIIDLPHLIPELSASLDVFDSSKPLETSVHFEKDIPIQPMDPVQSMAMVRRLDISSLDDKNFFSETTTPLIRSKTAPMIRESPTVTKKYNALKSLIRRPGDDGEGSSKTLSSRFQLSNNMRIFPNRVYSSVSLDNSDLDSIVPNEDKDGDAVYATSTIRIISHVENAVTETATNVHVFLTEGDTNTEDISQEAGRDGNMLDAFLKFTVTDSGTGIDDAQLEELFQVNHGNNHSGARSKIGGVGLGLYSLAKRIEALGGYCGAYRRDNPSVSITNGGSKFWFAIPYVVGEREKLSPPWNFNQSYDYRDHANGHYSLIKQNSFSSEFGNHHGMKENSKKQYDRKYLPSNYLGGKSPNETASPLSSSSLMDRIENALSATSDRIVKKFSHSGNHPTLSKLSTQEEDVPCVLSSPKLVAEHATIMESFSVPMKMAGSFVINKELHIMVVDDSMTILKMTSAILKRQGYHVDQAENGSIALKKYLSSIQHHTYYDIILMDIQMPVMDGLEATKQIRLNESTHHTNGDRSPFRQIIVGCSANSDDESMKAAYEAGVDSFVGKPFSISTFNHVCRSLLEKEKIFQLKPSSHS